MATLGVTRQPTNKPLSGARPAGFLAAHSFLHRLGACEKIRIQKGQKKPEVLEVAPMRGFFELADPLIAEISRNHNEDPLYHFPVFEETGHDRLSRAGIVGQKKAEPALGSMWK